ncbi:helix-turn-helix transcriptional regulator [Streptomyces sp. R-74717]
MTQQKPAGAASVALGTIRNIERRERGDTDDTLDAIAAALGVTPCGLIAYGEHASTRTRDALPALAAAITAYDGPFPSAA